MNRHCTFRSRIFRPAIRRWSLSTKQTIARKHFLHWVRTTPRAGDRLPRVANPAGHRSRHDLWGHNHAPLARAGAERQKLPAGTGGLLPGIEPISGTPSDWGAARQGAWSHRRQPQGSWSHGGVTGTPFILRRMSLPFSCSRISSVAAGFDLNRWVRFCESPAWHGYALHRLCAGAYRRPIYRECQRRHPGRPARKRCRKCARRRTSSIKIISGCRTCRRWKCRLGRRGAGPETRMRGGAAGVGAGWSGLRQRHLAANPRPVEHGEPCSGRRPLKPTTTATGTTVRREYPLSSPASTPELPLRRHDLQRRGFAT